MTPRSPLTGEPTGNGEVRHHLEHHVTPGEAGSAALAAVYLAGRADLVADLAHGLTEGMTVEEVLQASAADDEALTDRFGLPPFWGTGEPPPAQPEPAVELKSLLELRDILNEG